MEKYGRRLISLAFGKGQKALSSIDLDNNLNVNYGMTDYQLSKWPCMCSVCRHGVTGSKAAVPGLILSRLDGYEHSILLGFIVTDL